MDVTNRREHSWSPELENLLDLLVRKLRKFFINKNFARHFIKARSIVIHKPVSWLHAFEVIKNLTQDIFRANLRFWIPRLTEQLLEVFLDDLSCLLDAVIELKLEAPHVFARYLDTVRAWILDFGNIAVRNRKLEAPRFATRWHELQPIVGQEELATFATVRLLAPQFAHLELAW